MIICRYWIPTSSICHCYWSMNFLKLLSGKLLWKMQGQLSKLVCNSCSKTPKCLEVLLFFHSKIRHINDIVMGKWLGCIWLLMKSNCFVLCSRIQYEVCLCVKSPSLKWPSGTSPGFWETFSVSVRTACAHYLHKGHTIAHSKPVWTGSSRYTHSIRDGTDWGRKLFLHKAFVSQWEPFLARSYS